MINSFKKLAQDSCLAKNVTRLLQVLIEATHMKEVMEEETKKMYLEAHHKRILVPNESV